MTLQHQPLRIPSVPRSPVFRPPLVGTELSRRLRQVRAFQRLVAGDVEASAQAGVMRVSIVGQVKAGKSTLINAVAGVSGLIPSDINPWTSVMTSVRVGPGTGGERMAFDFFSRAEWDSQRDQRHADELVSSLSHYLPQADYRAAVDELHQEYQRATDSLEATARRDLGAELESLWGTSARFEGVSRSVLERYVCTASPGVGERRYSSVVRSARVFVDRNRFAVPTTLLDTPGVNDPSLARAKLSRDVLSGAHITVVVMNAQQVMSTADRELLRLLSCLHKDRLVLFVNRMDQLGGGAEEAAKIRAHVVSLARNIFPDGEIPIVMGSARAAEMTWASDAEVQALSSDPYWRKYLGLADALHLDLKTLRERLYVRSGLAELSEALSATMLSGPGAIAVSSRAAQVLAQAGGLLQERSPEVGDKTLSVGEVDAGLAVVAESLRATTARLIASLDASLDALVARESEEQLRTFMRRFAQDRVRVWTADLAPIRTRMEGHFVAAHRALSEEIGRAQASLGSAMLGRAVGDSQRRAVDLTLRPERVDPNPSLGPLMQPMPVEIGSLWRRFWSRTDRVANKAYAFEDELRKSLTGSARGLSANTQVACEVANSAFMARLQALCRVPQAMGAANEDRRVQIRSTCDDLVELLERWER